MRFSIFAVLTGFLFSFFLFASAEEKYTVLRVTQGEKLSYEVLQDSEVKDRLEELKKEKAKAKALKTYKTEAEAEKASRSDADKTGYFPCWRCNGEGTLKELPEELPTTSQPANAKTAKCPVCKGKKRSKSTGYAILKVEMGPNWSYFAARKEMMAFSEEQLANGAKSLGLPDAPKIKSVKAFKPGEFDLVQEELEKMKEKAKGQKGFQERFAQMMLPPLQWPSEFYTK